MFGLRIAPLIIIQDHEVVFKVRLQKKRKVKIKKKKCQNQLWSLFIYQTKIIFYVLLYLAFLVLTNFKVILGFLGLCRANWGWGRDQKTVLGSTHKCIVSTFDF